MPPSVTALLFEQNFVHIEFGEYVAHRLATFDGDFRKIFLKNEVFHAVRSRAQRYFHRFGFAIRIGRKIDHFRAVSALGQVVLFVARNAIHRKTLDVVVTRTPVAIDGVVDGAAVVFDKHSHMNNTFAHIEFVGYAHHFVFAIFEKDDDVVDVGTVAHKLHIFVLFQPCADKTFAAIDIEFLVGFHHFGGLNSFEVAYFGEARKFLSVLLFQMFEPIDGVVDDVVEIVLHTLHLRFDVGNLVFGFFDVEFRNFAHRFVAEFQHIVAHNLAAKKFAVRVELALYLRYLIVPSLEIVFQNFVDALFEE